MGEAGNATSLAEWIASCARGGDAPGDAPRGGDDTAKNLPRGALGIVIVGAESALTEALAETERLCAAHAMEHLPLDLAKQAAGTGLRAAVEALHPSPRHGRIISLLGLRRWIGPGEEASARAADQLEADGLALLEAGYRILLWLSPHAWEIIRHRTPRLAEQWTFLGRRTPADAELVAAQVVARLRVALVPIRHRGRPERARRRFERFGEQMRGFDFSNLSREALAWGVVIPWLRTLLDVGELERVREEFVRWAPSLETIAAAYGLAQLCCAEAELLLDRQTEAGRRLDEARVRMQSAGHLKGVALSHTLHGLLEASGGRMDGAELHLARATEIAEEGEFPRLIAWNCVVLGLINLLRGHEEKAHFYIEYAWIVFESEGDAGGIAGVLWVDAVRLGWFGERDEARDQLRRVWRILTIVRDGTALIAFVEALCVLLRRMGAETDAAEHLSAARSACEEIPHPEGIARLDALARQFPPAPTTP